MSEESKWIQRLNLNCSDKITILRNDDILAIIQKMLHLRDGKDEIDDIDHLANEELDLWWTRRKSGKNWRI